MAMGSRRYAGLGVAGLGLLLVFAAASPTRGEDQKKEEARKLPKLIDLGAGKCIPCKKMAPILEKLKEDLKDKAEVVFIDVWKNPDAGREYNIQLIPTQIFFDAEGKEVFRHVGFFSREDILAQLKKMGVDVPEEE